MGRKSATPFGVCSPAFSERDGAYVRSEPMIRASVQRSTNRTFLRSFVVILIAQAITILVAWWSLDFNIRAWLNTRTTLLTRISQQAASAADWTQTNKIPKDRDSRLGDEYQDRLDKLSNRYFVGKEGSVFLTLVERGEEYDIYSTKSGQLHIGTPGRREPIDPKRRWAWPRGF